MSDQGTTRPAPPQPPSANADDNQDDQNQQQNQQQTNNNVQVNDGASRNSRSQKSQQQQLPEDYDEEELPRGISLFVNFITFILAGITIVIFADSIARKHIYETSMPSSNLSTSVSDKAIQTMTLGNVLFYFFFLIGAIVISFGNFLEVLKEKVFAKYRRAQLVLNRVLSGSALAAIVTIVPELLNWIARKSSLTADADIDSYDEVLAFWIMFLLTSIFVIVMHAAAPELDQRRHDRVKKERNNRKKYGGGFDDDDEELSPFGSRAPDQYE